jgi:hypothetical protein
MKRWIEAVVVTTSAVAVAVGSARAEDPAAPAPSPVVKLSGEASLTKQAADDTVRAPARFHVDAAFSTDTPGADPFTIQQAVVYFPDHAGTNGRLFPSCSVRQIARFRGNIARCPKGSKIGSGTVKASAIQIGVTATGRVTMFNGPGGKSITLNIQTLLPAYINESIDAPITQLHGRYGEKLTLVVPHSLQEILSGVFVGVRDFDVTITGAVRVHGVAYSYLRARTCPSIPMHGVFGFKDWTSGRTASVTSDAKVRCSAR